MPPVLLRTYQMFMSSGVIRNGASDCTYTFLIRPSVSRKLFTYCDAHAIENVWSIAAAVTPSAFAFSRSMSTLYCGVSFRPFGRTSASADPSRPSRAAAARGHQRFVAETGVVRQLEVEAGSGAEFWNRRRVERDHHRVLVLRVVHERPADQRLHLLVRTLAMLVRFQLHEHETGVLAAARKAEAVNGEHRVDHILLGGGQVRVDVVSVLPVVSCVADGVCTIMNM